MSHESNSKTLSLRNESDAQEGRLVLLRRSAFLNGLTRSVVVFLLLGMLASYDLSHVIGQQNSIDDPEWRRGYHGMAVICQSAGLEVIEDFEDYENAPVDERLLIILGDVSNVQSRYDGFLNRGGAVLVATDRGGSRSLRDAGIYFNSASNGDYLVANSANGYSGYDDCPIIQRIDQSHPVTRGVQTLIANRTGHVEVTSTRRINSSSQGVLAWLPIMREPNIRQPAALVTNIETRNGGRGLFVADQSIFSNQMILHGDNANFAIQAINWLAESPNETGRRRVVLIVDDSRLINPMNPSELEVMVPPPTPAQVIDMLRRLSPEMLLEFTNEVVAAVEDDGVVNELLIDYQHNQVSERQTRRFVLICLALIVGAIVVWRLLAGGNTNDRARLATDVMGEVLLMEGPDVAYERFLAAHELLRSFRYQVGHVSPELANVSISDLRQVQGTVQNRRFQQQFKQLGNELKRFQRSHWTEKRLMQIESMIHEWHEWLRHGILAVRQ